MKTESTGHIYTLVILTGDREFLDLGRIDEKGKAKSIETGTLWLLHPDSGRLLPYRPELPLLGIERKADRIEATLGTGTDPGKDADRTADEAHRNAHWAVENHRTGKSPKHNEVLAQLAELIHVRNEERPEGSYTTYLFEQGLEKIRKKTGEETVELILATERERIVSEGADLIYHLLVLLEASEISYKELLDELERRRAEG